MDAQQWEQDATEKQQKVAALEQEVEKAQQELQQQISSFKVRTPTRQWECSTAQLYLKIAVVNMMSWRYQQGLQNTARLCATTCSAVSCTM